MKGVKKRYLFGGGIIIVAAAYLLYLSFGSSVSYYVTVSEFFERGSELHDTSVRVAGIVADKPVNWDAEELELRFTVTEGGREMDVVYEGVQPSGLTAGASILVEGEYGSGREFSASRIILKCPSKYEALE
jgi:cytochrome c-type biogenesis protein CcmE